ncbi:MAG: GGDEF domain-containing protein [Deltaproteobacteria bacterium]|nr:GGDEF domain-containing protein [Deltaproteobacteria bacterium]
MKSRSLESLPEDLARRIRLAFVPPHLRALVQNLPSRLELRARLSRVPGPGDVVACQLLKLATLGRGIAISEVEAVDGPTELTVTGGDRSRVLRGDDLSRSLDATVHRLLVELLDANAFVAALDAFASRSAKLDALQTLTSHMLRAEDLDQALFTMLSGISSGFGLGFHRVALFQYDEQRGGFVGTRAIGPLDESEAHRIWEAIELEEKTLDAILSDYTKRNVDARFEQHVQTVTLAPHDPRDEVQQALDAPQPQRFASGAIVHRELRALAPAREFVLAAIRSHGKVRGLLFADDRYGDERVSDDRLAFVGFFIDQMALVWENLSLLRRVEREARYDALTGVFTRRAFEERLNEEQARSSRTGSSCGLLVIDVDRFKEINDTQGHAAGDAVLRALGAVLKRDLRTHDVVGRLGGDEFVVLLPGASSVESTAVARRIGGSARAQGVSLSIGGACWPQDCPNPADLLAIADARLYQAKRAGRGRSSFGAEASAFDD